ncbi:MAG: radical SAM protein, partial [bacterium]|nr:radical SAM protein [bacterium]
KYQMAGVDEIEKELIQQDSLKKVKYVHFIDDTFNVPQERFKDILRMMIRNKFVFKWYSHYRCQFADEETIRLMKESGCEGVFLGIESGSDTILENMNKRATVAKYLNGIALLKEYGILTYGSFIIGFPGETEETVQETIRFIREGGLDFFRAQLWYCEPITPIFKQKDKYDIKGESFEWSHNTMDSKRASELVEDIFKTVDSPIWVPQYNFECDALFHLYPNRITLEEVKNFLKAFNGGIRAKLQDPAKKEIGFEIIKQIKIAIKTNDDFEETSTDESNLIDQFDADFDF